MAGRVRELSRCRKSGAKLLQVYTARAAAGSRRRVMGRPWAMDFTDSDNAPRGELPKPPGFSESSSHDTVRRAPCIRTGGLG